MRRDVSSSDSKVRNNNNDYNNYNYNDNNHKVYFHKHSDTLPSSQLISFSIVGTPIIRQAYNTK